MRRRFLRASLLTLVLAFAAPASAQAPAKLKITNAADLPVHTYNVGSKVSSLLDDPMQVFALAAAVSRDIRGDLEKYDIVDRATQSRLYTALLDADVLQGDADDAHRDAAQVRSLEDKPEDRALSGRLAEALLNTRLNPGTDFHETLRKNVEQAYQGLPQPLIQDRARRQKLGLELLTRNFFLGQSVDSIDPLATDGLLSQEQAYRVLHAAWILRELLPNKTDLIAAYSAVLTSSKAAPNSDIWAAREVTLSHSTALTPIIISVWDSGVDSHLYRSQRVSGTLGFAYDARSQPASPLLPTLSAGAATAYQHDLTGLTDMSSGVESPAAMALRARLTHLPPLQVKRLMTGILAFGSYAHGTFVAGIALHGNPAARLLVCRLSHGLAVSPAEAAANAATYQKTINTFKARGVRVVNMSWDVSPEKIQRVLERQGRGGSPAERRRLAQQLYDTGFRGFSRAIQSAPHILFVAAAGNQNENIQFNQSYPASLHAPNLIVVGAVDGAGEETSFTSFGNVDVYANGVNVPSFVPGGATLKLSGTSMAAPQVTNLAAKVLAKHPTLSVAQLKAALLRGADPHTIGGRTIRLLNPKQTLARLNTHP